MELCSISVVTTLSPSRNSVSSEYMTALIASVVFRYNPIHARLGAPMDNGDAEAIRDEFRKISELLAGQPRVLVHRDYHSRNLMVAGERLGVIDFQDALMGPATYDLASLLRDAYIALDEALIGCASAKRVLPRRERARIAQQRLGVQSEAGTLSGLFAGMTGTWNAMVILAFSANVCGVPLTSGYG